MIKKYNRLGLLFGISGICLHLFAVIPVIMLVTRPAVGEIVAAAMFLAGTALLFTGLVYYAKSKGRSGALALLGLLDLLGIIILGCLKDLAPGPPSVEDPICHYPAVQTTG